VAWDRPNGGTLLYLAGNFAGLQSHALTSSAAE
jgi:hypothetical protein